MPAAAWEEASSEILAEIPEYSGSTYIEINGIILTGRARRWRRSLWKTAKLPGYRTTKIRQDYTGSKEELIAEGYEPCEICNP